MIKDFKIFGCGDFLSGGRIIAFISLMESIVKIVISVIFITWIKNYESQNQPNNMKKGLKN